MQPAPPNFDRIAGAYRWLEYLTLGPLLQRTRCHFLPLSALCRSALVLGDGDGRFLAELLRCNTSIHADAVDGSSAMLNLLGRRAGKAAPDARLRLCPYEQDARLYNPRREYDLVVTHFFLDCLTQAEVDRLTLRLSPSLAPGALWLLSEFRVPPGLFGHVARPGIRLLYAAFRVLTGLRVRQVPDYASSLAAAGFVCLARKYRLAGVLSAELWQRPGDSS